MLPCWTVLHSSALGDLVLTMQLALRLPGVCEVGALRVLSRINPGDLSACRPSIERRSTEGLGLHWLFGDHTDAPPERLRDAGRGTRILSALGGPQTKMHRRLQELGADAVYSFDPRSAPGSPRHITQQWQTQLESQGLLVPKCVHQRPAQRGLGVPEELRARGHALLSAAARAAGFIPRGATGRSGCVVIHPGSGGRSKCWPLRCFVEVALALRDSTDAAVCFLVGPVEQETWPASQLAALRAEFPLLSCPDPDELAAVLAAAGGYVGNDAGPAHLAALLGRPTVTIFGPTSSSVWRPLGLEAVVYQGDPAASTEDWGIRPEAVASAVSERTAAASEPLVRESLLAPPLRESVRD